MSEEEKKAIEFLEIWKEYAVLEENKSINIVLNLISRQQKELDNYKIIENANKERLEILEKDLDKKYKIIDLMAEYIGEIDVSEDFCNMNNWQKAGYIDFCDENCKVCVKQHFENKVKEKKC